MSLNVPSLRRAVLAGLFIPTLLLAACGNDDTSNNKSGNNTTPPAKSCEMSSDCDAISCDCKDGTSYNSFTSCNIVNGEGTCGTCETACAEHGGVFSNPAGCLDPTDGADSAFRGDAEVGASCDKDALQSPCASGRCINDGSGQGFCTDTCTSDDDCNGLKCASYTAGGTTYRYCLAGGKSWCSRP